MLRFAALAFLLLAACRSTPPRTPAAPEARLDFRIDVPAPSPRPQTLLVSLQLPLGGSIRALEASALVGNALLPLALDRGPSTVSRPFAELRWDDVSRVLRAETDGLPVELVLRLAAPPGAPRSEIESALVAGTSADADGRPITGLRARLASADVPQE